MNSLPFRRCPEFGRSKYGDEFVKGDRPGLLLMLLLEPEGLKSKAGRTLKASLWGLERSAERLVVLVDVDVD